MARAFSGLLLYAAVAALALPLGLYAGPPLLAALEGGGAQRQEVVPAYQLAPRELSADAAGSALAGVPDPQAPLPDQDTLAGLLDAELSVAGSGAFYGAVLDVASGDLLYDAYAREPVTPASNLKILTAAAALSALGGEARLETAVYQGSDPDTVVLRGGGDVLLTAGESDGDAVVGHAGLASLAQATADALSERGVRGPVTVQVDDTLFTGPTLSPAWNEEDIEAGEAADVHPLAINSAWATEGYQGGPRAEDPALAAAEAFAAALSEALAAGGITVGTDVERGAAPAGTDRLASVESATVGEQVQQMLLASDNYLAESLARLTALDRGYEASFTGATAAVKEAVAGLGVSTAGVVLGDTSGLGAGTRISTLQLADTLRQALTSGNNDVRALAYSLPVAGLSGTLAGRLTGDGGAAAGLVRAKTGSLLAVTSLSGYVTDADGRLLAFAFVANGLEGNTAQARAAVDSAAAVLAGCGCG